MPNLPDYDSSKPTKHLMYLDANNLYGWAMSQPLPTGGFQWLTNAEILQLDIENVPDSIGYFLEVDLEYPSELHDLHADYPLAPGMYNILHKTKCFHNLFTFQVKPLFRYNIYLFLDVQIENNYYCRTLTSNRRYAITHAALDALRT